MCLEYLAHSFQHEIHNIQMLFAPWVKWNKAFTSKLFAINPRRFISRKVPHSDLLEPKFSGCFVLSCRVSS